MPKKTIEQQISINGCDHFNQVWALVLASLLLLTATFFIISKLEEKVFSDHFISLGYYFSLEGERKEKVNKKLTGFWDRPV